MLPELSGMGVLMAATALIGAAVVVRRRRIGEPFRIGLKIPDMALGTLHSGVRPLKHESKVIMKGDIHPALTHHPR